MAIKYDTAIHVTCIYAYLKARYINQDIFCPSATTFCALLSPVFWCGACALHKRGTFPKTLKINAWIRCHIFLLAQKLHLFVGFASWLYNGQGQGQWWGWFVGEVDIFKLNRNRLFSYEIPGGSSASVYPGGSQA